VLREEPAPRTAAAVQTDPDSGLRRELGVRDLTLFAIACVAAPRWIPVAAHAGPGSITVWLLAAVLVGAPLAVAVPALMKRYPGPGGLYAWTRNDFGPAHGFISFWLYWVGLAFWYPSAAVFYLSSSAYAFGPSFTGLADSRVFLICASLAAIWIALGTNLVGLKTGKWTENSGAIAVAAIGFILIAAAALYSVRHPAATPLRIVPEMDWNIAPFWAAMAYGVTGVEFLGMMSAEIRSPERSVRPAIWLTTFFVAAFYAAATWALLVFLRPGVISEIRGFAQGGAAIAGAFAAPWVSIAIGILLLFAVFGAFGGVGTALSRMPFAAGVDHLLPAAFGRVHPRWHTPHVAILTLGVVSSALLLLSQWGDTMQVAYQEMVSLMLVGGFLPYIYMFLSAWKAERKLAASVGLGVTLFCLAFSVIPTSDVTNIWLYEGKLAAGTAAMIGSGWLLYAQGRARSR
jgi:amino acid transporter